MTHRTNDPPWMSSTRRRPPAPTTPSSGTARPRTADMGSASRGAAEATAQACVKAQLVGLQAQQRPIAPRIPVRTVGHEPVQAILRHLGFDGRYLGDLVPAGLRVIAVEGLTTLAAGGRLHRDGLLDLLRRHQGPLLAGMAWLAAPPTTG